MTILAKTRRRTFFMFLGMGVIALILVILHTRWAMYDVILRSNAQQNQPLNDAFVAAGRHGVLWLRLPDGDKRKIEPITRFDTLGDARAVVQSGAYLYVADKSSLRVLQIDTKNNTLREVGWVGAPASQVGKQIADQVAFKDNIVFVGYGMAGVQVIDVSTPQKPRDTGVWIKIDEIGQVRRLIVDGNHLYVAAGEAGLLIYDISTPQTPKKLGVFNPPQPVLDVAVVGGSAAYVAEGTGGLALVTFSNPASPVEVSANRDLGNVQRVVVAISSEQQWILVGGPGNGLRVLSYDARNPNSFTPVSSLPKVGATRDISISSGHDDVCVVGEKSGLSVVNIQNIQNPSLKTNYRLASVVTWVRMLGWSLLAGIALFILWIGFFAQFSLPVRIVGERLRAWQHLLLYALGRHGPAISVEDGEIRENKSESLRKGRGVILLDTASAGVLRTPGEFTRAVGPGVVFTRKNERLAGVVDLHKQTKFIGPKPGINVFAPKSPGETDEEYQARCAARDETIGLTRDGIAIVPNIIAVFGLYTDSKRWPPRFEYRKESVWRAIVGEGINLDVPETLPEKRRMVWNWLPAYLAVDVWRDLVRRYTLTELFDAKFPDPKAPGDSSRKLTGMQVIADEVANHFRSREVAVLDEFGRYQWDDDGNLKTMPSEEWKMMQARGLKVLTILVTNLRFQETVEQQLITDWQTTWETKVGDLGGESERIRIQKADQVQMKALQDYATWTSERLYRRLLDKNGSEQPDAIESLEMMLSDLQEHVAKELNLRRRMTNEWDDLQDLLDWLRNRL